MLSRLLLRRQLSTLPLKYTIERLKERSLIRVSGTDIKDYLQGLITNDASHLSHGIGSMYTMFLNTKGRILFDAIVYRTPKECEYLIESDSNGIDIFLKHLKMYRVRRKIDVTDFGREMFVYSMFDPNPNRVHEISRQLEGLTVSVKELKEILPETSNTCKIFKDVYIFCDPRVVNLGVRLIAPKSVDVTNTLSEVFNVDTDPKPNRNYRWLRYNLGIGEGPNDLPMDNSFPLEANCDYLHGISFHKGCYIGQELTARTHHTGVVRKRLMPLYFTNPIENVPEEDKIVNNGVNLGKLRGVVGNVGLALLRVEKVLAVNQICVGDGIATTLRPFWWPIEAPKERVSSLSKS